MPKNLTCFLASLTFLFGAAGLPLHAQNLQWAKRAGGNMNDLGQAIAIDAAGNSYLTGYMRTTATFGPGETHQTNLVALGQDVFVSKHDPNGLLLWAKRIGTASGFGTGVGVDSAGNVYVTGYFALSVTFASGEANQVTYGVTGGNDVFIAKYGSDGSFIWAKTFGGFFSEYVEHLVTDAAGNTYITGRFGYAVTFGPGEPNQTVLTGTGNSEDVFVAKYNSAGLLQWAKRAGGNSSDQGQGIALDGQGNAYVTGVMSLLSTFGEGEPNQTVLAAPVGGFADLFVAKFASATGALVWAKRAGGVSADRAYGIAVDSAGSAYVTGYITGRGFFAPGEPNETFVDGEFEDVFVAKYTTDGTLVWAKGAGTAAFDSGTGIAVDPLSNVFVTGYHNGAAVFGRGEPNQTEVRILGTVDIFVAKYNTNGELQWATSAGSIGDDRGTRIAADAAGNSYVTGRFVNVATFGFGTPTQTVLTSALGSDVFVAKYRDAPPTLTISPGGSGTYLTSGLLPNLRAGYSKANVISGPTPSGVAVFSLTQNGYVVSEAGVPASPPTQSARIFIDYRTGVPSGIGALNINTGFAIANLGSSIATLSYTLRDRSGNVVATGQGTLAAGAHFAKFIDQLQSVAPGFMLPGNFPTATRFGSLQIASSQPASIVALRLTTNQRGETLLTSTPVADLTATPSTAPLYFPQLADSGGYKTTLILMNTSGAIESGTFSIFDDNGNGLTVRDSNGTVGSSFPYSIPPGGSFVFETDGSGAGVQTGWVRVTPTSGSAPVGSGVFSYAPGGILVTESGVPAAVPTTRARVFVDKSAGHNTGIAIANHGAAGNTVTVAVFESNGSTPAGNAPGSITLAPNGHTGKFAGEVVEGLPDGFTGVLEISSPTPFVAVTLRALVNGRGDFLLTTFPIADANQTAPSPIVFPQIANGGGYSTQFIFVSATGGSTLTLDLLYD